MNNKQNLDLKKPRFYKLFHLIAENAGKILEKYKALRYNIKDKEVYSEVRIWQKKINL